MVCVTFFGFSISGLVYCCEGMIISILDGNFVFWRSDSVIGDCVCCLAEEEDVIFYCKVCGL